MHRDDEKALRSNLERLLGIPPHVAAERSVRTLSRRATSVCHVDEIEITDATTGESIPALFTAPRHAVGPFPAVLYLHAHGNRYDIGKRELIDGRPSLQPQPYAEALADRGIAALCLDMPTFGARAHLTEQATAKQLLWHGKTLFGGMLRDLQIGLDALTQRPDVDRTRLGAMGLSMGATQAYWLAALDHRIKVIAHLCCFADLQWLVDHGAHDLHGIYMMVPGLLAAVSTGEIAAAVAPRPQLCCVGLQDPLTPEPALEIGASTVAHSYQLLDASRHWTLYADPASGHLETPAMRRLTLDHLERHLRRG